METAGDGFVPPLDQLREWHSELRARIEDRDNRIAALRREIEEDAAKLAAIAALLGKGQDSASTPTAAETTGEFAGLKPTPAVLALLKANPRQWFRPAEALRVMRDGKFETSAKQASGLVRCILHRLAERGLVEIRGKRRRKQYRLQEQTPKATGVEAQSP